MRSTFSNILLKICVLLSMCFVLLTFNKKCLVQNEGILNIFESVVALFKNTIQNGINECIGDFIKSVPFEMSKKRERLRKRIDCTIRQMRTSIRLLA